MYKTPEHKKGKSPILQERDFPLSDSKSFKRTAQQPRETVPTSSLTPADYQKNRKPVRTQRKQTRINPDSRIMLWFTVCLVLCLGLCSFMVSFNGLHDVAAWVGLPTWLRWTVPIFIDIAILAYSMAVVIHRARSEKVALTWLTLGAFTSVSVVANAVHALAVGDGQTIVQSWIGAAIAAAAPLGVFAATEELSRLAFGTDDYHQEPEEEQEEAELVETPDREQLPPAVPELESDWSEVKRQLAAPIEITAPEPEPEPEPEPISASELHSIPEPQDQSTANNHIEQKGTDRETEALRQWVRDRIKTGEKITGAGAAKVIDKSDRTGLNRLNALRESEPELFNGEK